MSQKSILFLLMFVLLGLHSRSVHATLSDDDIVKVFTVKNHSIQGKDGANLTFSLYSSKPYHAFDTAKLQPNFEDLQTLQQGHARWDQTIPYRSWTLYINLPDEEERQISHIGTIDLQEIFYRDNEGNKKILSSFLILKNIKILESWEHKGIGRAALHYFLDKLEALDTEQISHEVYIILGNSHPGVYKMYLENGFNYFVKRDSSKIFNIKNIHDEKVLERLSKDSFSTFTNQDVPTRCVMKREPGGGRLYQPYFF